jgi:hypothetical protein
MFFRPVIEVQDAPAFLTLAKDLKPLGRVIVFEPGGKYRFMTRQGDDVMSVSYTPPGPYPASNPQGGVTHNVPVRPPYDTKLGWTQFYRNLNITTRLSARDKSIEAAIKRVLGSSKAVKMKWTSSSPKIKNLRIVVHNIGVQLTITLEYSDIHVRELTKMLNSAGFKVIPGRITHS